MLPAGVKPVLPVTRVVFFSAACFATIAGIQLYLLTEHTDQYFAWTIAQPLSAAFLGGVYWSGAALFLATLTERAWSHVRIAVVAVSAFVALMLLTTLLHLDRFHLRATALPPLFASWIWMAVYIVFPLLLVLVIVLQVRAPGADPPRVAPLSPIVRFALGLNTLVCLVVCAALFLAPTAMSSVWPWPLTALTGRAVSTGFFVIAAGSFQILRENDWERDRVGGVSYALFGFLQLLALARYAGTVAWGSLGTWLYVALMCSVVGGGAYLSLRTWGPLRAKTLK
jgi:hypothetical protein